MRLSKKITPQFLSARDAVDRIPDRARLLVEASGGGVIEPSDRACGALHAHGGALSAVGVLLQRGR